MDRSKAGRLVRYLPAPGRETALCHWGLIPTWVKDTKIKPINAKAETVKEKPFYRNAFKKQRCLIPANSYYEWQEEKGKKQPYYIKPADDSDPFSFASLWETWEGSAETIQSFIIITTKANKTAAKILNRMPVILAKGDYDRWLVDGAGELLKPCSDDVVVAYKVSSQVNKPGNEGIDLIKPI